MKKIYSRLTWLLARLGGFSAAPGIHLLFTSVILTASFAYGYAKGTVGKLHPEIVLVLGFGVLLSLVLHLISYGALSAIGIPSPFGHVRRLNNIFDAMDLRQDRSADEYRQALLDLTRYPQYQSVYGIFDVILVLSVVVGYDALFLHTGHIPYYVIAGIISLPIHTQFCYVTADLHLGRFRSEVKKRLFEMGEIPPNYHSFSLKVKFFLVLVIIILAAYILITLMNSDAMQTKEGLRYIITFSFFALLLLSSLAVMYFSAIFVSIKELQQAALALERGDDPVFFSRATDLELANLSSGFFSAVLRTKNYQKDLEEQVKKATADLVQANEELRHKDAEMQMELNFAADIQKSIMPETMTPWNGISFTGYFSPMNKVSGDYYDIFKTSAAVYVLQADVSGHGVPAALVTMAAKQAFSAAINPTASPAEIFQQVNQDLCSKITTQDYLTAFMLRIDENNRITYSNASHPKAIHLHYATGEISLYDTNGLFIGAMEEAGNTYENGETTLKAGDRIFLYTDGVIEHKNVSGEEFGLERLTEIIREAKKTTLVQSKNIIIGELRSFMGTAPVRDDISLLCLELNPRWNEFASLFAEGKHLLKLNQTRGALEKFIAAAEAVPEMPRIHYAISRAYFKLREYHKAEQALLPYEKIFHNDIRGLQLKAGILIALGRSRDAHLVLQKLRALDATNRVTARIIANFEKMSGETL